MTESKAKGMRNDFINKNNVSVYVKYIGLRERKETSNFRVLANLYHSFNNFIFIS